MNMISKLSLVVLVGATAGGVAGWFMFHTIPGAVGLGSSMAAGLGGALISLSRAR